MGLQITNMLLLDRHHRSLWLDIYAQQNLKQLDIFLIECGR